MNNFFIHIIRFVLFVFVQGIILNQIEFGLGLQIFIYPLFIFLLPVRLNPYLLMLISFVTGFIIDILSNTYGLHASSAVVVAFLKPMIFKAFEPREGYDEILELNIYNMKFSWNLSVLGIFLIIHHLWIYLLEMFKLNEIHILLTKVIVSTILSFITCIIIQYLFFKKTKGGFIN